MVRLKHRYVLFELMETHHRPEARRLLDLVRASLLHNFGCLAAGQLASSLQLKYYSQRTGRGILQADRAHFRLAWAALTFLRLEEGNDDDGGGGGFVRAFGISGTVRKAEERLVGLDRDDLFLTLDT